MLGDLFRRGIGERLAGPHQSAQHGSNGGRHSHPPDQRDRRIGQQPAHLTFEVFVLGGVVLAVLQLFERVVVALVEQEEIAVGDDLVDELVEQLHPRPGLVSSRIDVAEAVEHVTPELVQPHVQLKEDVLLALEVVVQRGLRDLQPLGDLPQRGLVVALLVEQLQRDVEDPLTRRPAGSPAAGTLLLSQLRILLDNRLARNHGEKVLACRPVRKLRHMNDVMIEAHGLVKRYGSTVALNGLDLEVPMGAILGVLGPNGAGKSTAVRILTTLSRPDAGTARVAGHDVVTETAAVQRSIGVTAQDATLDEVLTGVQNLVMVGRLSGLSRSAAKARAAELLDRFELSEAGGRILKTYSGGMRRRLDLAAGLVTRPPVIFLDEPTTGLDPTSRVRMWGVIRELVADGATLLLTTQYLDEADELADRIVVIDHGRAIALGTAAELKAQVGGARLEVTLSEADPAAAAALSPYVSGEVSVSHDGRRLRAPVPTGGGLATTVVRALDAAGVRVDDVDVHQPSLDDVFFALTGHPVSEVESERPASELEPALS